VLWEALTGERLFEGQTDLDVFKQIRNCAPRPLQPLRPDAPPALVAAIERALCKDPTQRYASAREMAFALAEVLRSSAVSTDAQQALGTNVIEARGRLAGRPRVVDDTQPTWDWKIDGQRARPMPPSVAATPADRTDPDIELSAPDLGVEPIILTQRKKP